MHISPVKIQLPVVKLVIDWALPQALLPGVSRQVVEAELGAWKLACI